MRIAFYTIALNEEAHCERWCSSTEGADVRIVLDTGSTDETVQRLRSRGVQVEQVIFDPWRFDVARNAALELVPSDVDICINLDMDEFPAPGWRSAIESAWTSDATRLRYSYVYEFKPEAPRQNWFFADKAHSRFGYVWRRPVHEALFTTLQNEVYVTTEKFVINQIQDMQKPTRANYLPLMECAHLEDPNDSQIAFWLGRELLYAGKLEQATRVLLDFLSLPTSRWDVERSEAHILLGRANPSNARTHLYQAICESPKRREAWLALAEHFYACEDWNGLLWASVEGMKIRSRGHTYLDREDAWGASFSDYGSLAAYNLGWRKKALMLVNQALALEPANERFIRNREFIRNMPVD